MSIKSILQQWLGATPAPDDDFWYRDAGGNRTFTGVSVTPESSKASTAVDACVSYISKTVASVPCVVYERTDAGQRPCKDHPLYPVLHDMANEELTAYEFWELAITQMLLHGNAYALQELDSRLNVKGMRLLEPERVLPQKNKETGLKNYLYQPLDGPRETYLSYEILHLPWKGYDGHSSLRGFSPVQLHRQAIGYSLAAEEYGARFFGDSAIPPHYIYTPANLSETSKKNLIAWLKETWGGLTNRFKPAVLDNGVEIKTVPINHRDIQFLELRKFQLEEIARIYGVPLHIIQSLDRATNNNIEHQSMEAVRDAIRPVCVRLEKRINNFLFGPQESRRYFAEFNLDGLLRGDSVSRAEYISKRVASATMTPNEGRKYENENPYADPAGDKLYIQGAMVPLEDAGKQVQQGSTPQ